MRHVPFSYNPLDAVALALLILYILDRAWKLACITRFFRRQELPSLETWPKVSLIQPITRGASGLARNLNTRALLNYPGAVQHVLVCDESDEESLQICRAWRETWPGLDARILKIAPKTEDQTPNTQDPTPVSIASKVEKMQAGAAGATGDLFCFIDDDVAPRPDNLTIFARSLELERTGGVFGLACYTNWDAVGSSLMSLFVNANALPSYIPLTYLCDPYTVTGHFFALRRDVFARSGGLDNMETLLCDDHEIARRIRAVGLRIVQTPAIYDVNNELPTVKAFHRQIRRWFVFTGRVLWPLTPNYERLVSSVFSLASLFPASLLFCALFARTWETVLSLAGALMLAACLYQICEVRYLARHTPVHRRPLLLWIILVTPWQALATMLSGREVIWRGQQIRVHADNTYEVLQ